MSDIPEDIRARAVEAFYAAWDDGHEEEVARALLDERNATIERCAEALQRIVDWADAYPLQVFPEPDLKRARELLEAGGMTLDAVSASSMRHCLKGVRGIAAAAIRSQAKE